MLIKEVISHRNSFFIVLWKIKKDTLFWQTVCNFTDGSLVQHQEWDGKESTITRKLEDGKLVVVSV